MPANRDTPREFRALGSVTIAAAEGEGADQKVPTFEGNTYTGGPMRPDGWFHQIVIDLDGVKVPSQHRPVLRQHDHNRILGHTTSVRVDKDGIQVAGVLSGHDSPHGKEVVALARNGFRFQLSVGAHPIRTEYLEDGEETTVNGQTVTGPLAISRETELGEISVVPLGADGNTTVNITASRGSSMSPFQAALKQLMADLRSAGKVKAAKYSDEDIDKMDGDEARVALKKCMKAAEEDEEEDDDEEEEEEKKKSESSRVDALLASATKKLQAGAAAELQRQADITHRIRAHGVSEVELTEGAHKGKRVVLAAHAIAEGWSADQTELVALRAARPGPGVGIPGGLGYSTSRPEMSEAVLEAAVLHASRHQFRLEDENFYTDSSPDGKTRLRRVPEYMEREVKAEMKGRYTDQVQQAAHTMFRGRIGPQELFRCAFQANRSSTTLDLRSENGVRSMMAEWDQSEKLAIRAEGASTISISNILANVLNKFALQGYLFVEQAWRSIAGIRPVNDFKPTRSINLLGDVMFKAFGPSGELEHASLTDQAFANQATPFGRIITIPWTHLVNDDLSMLSGVPMKIGQGAGLALNDTFWTLWTAMAAGTVDANDGVEFWRTTSSITAKDKKDGTAYKANKTTGAGSAMSLAALKIVKALFDNQVDPNGNPLGFDGSKPVLLFPPTLWADVMTALQSPALVAIALASGTPTVQGGSNVWQNMYEPVMSRYVENANYVNSATAWWMLFNPVALPVIEVSFLNGVDTPAVLQAGPDYQFDRLGISIRGTMPFGVNAQNFRGGVYAVGA